MSVLIVGLSYGARNVLSYTRRTMQHFLAFRDSLIIPLKRSPQMSWSTFTTNCLDAWESHYDWSFPPSALRTRAYAVAASQLLEPLQTVNSIFRFLAIFRPSGNTGMHKEACPRFRDYRASGRQTRAIRFADAAMLASRCRHCHAAQPTAAPPTRTHIEVHPAALGQSTRFC